MASRNPPLTPPPLPPPPPPPPPPLQSHSSAAVYEDIRIHFPRLLQQSSTPDLSAAALAAADLPLPPSPSVSTHRLLHPSSAQQGHYHSLNRGHPHTQGGSSSPNPSFRGLPRRTSAASGESHSLPLFAAATARASSALASTMPSLLHRRAVVGLIVADLVMSVGVFAAIAANATVALPPESSLWSRLAPTLDLAMVNLVRGLALVWLVAKGWLPISPTTLTMSTALYAAGKAMSLLTPPYPTAPTSLISLYTCYSLVLPLVESLHLRAALASFASRRSSVTPSTMTPPTPIRASTMPSTSSSSAPGGAGGDTRYASHRSSRRTQRPAVTTATFASGANRPLLDEADSRDYRTFLGAPPTAKQVARAALRRDSMGPGEGDAAASAAVHRQQQVQQAMQQQQQSRRLIRAPWLSDILAGLTGHRPIPPPPPPLPPAPHPSFAHDDWGRSRSHSHSGALLSPRSHALAFGHPHPPPPIHQYTSLADPPLQRTRRPTSGLMHPPSLNPARWSLATFDSADLARLSSAVQPWAAQYASVESAPQPTLRHPPGMCAPLDVSEGGQSTMRAVRAQSSASSSTYDSEAEEDAGVGSPPPPVPVYHHHHHHGRPHRGDADQALAAAAGYKRYRPAPLVPHFRSLSMSHLGSPSPGYYAEHGASGEVVISPAHATHDDQYDDHHRDDGAGHAPVAAAPAAADTHPPPLAINTSMLASPPTPSASHSNPSTAPPTPFGTYSAAAQKLARPAEASFRSGAATVGGDSRTLARGGARHHPPRGHARNRSSASMAAMASSDDGGGGGAGGAESYEYPPPAGVDAYHHHRLSSYSQQSGTSGVGDEEDEVSSSERGGGRGHRYMYDDDDDDDDEPPGSAKDTATVYSALSAHLYRPAAGGYYQGHHAGAGAESSRSGSGNHSPLVYHPSQQDLVALALDPGAGTGSGAGAGGWMAAANTVASGRHISSPATVGGRSFVTAPSGSMSIGTFRGVPPPPPPPPPPMAAYEQHGPPPGAFRRLSESLKRALYGAEIQFAFASGSASARPALTSALTDLAQSCRTTLDTDPHSGDDAAAESDIQLTLAACHLYLAALSVPDESWSTHWWIATRTLAHARGGGSPAARVDAEAWFALAHWVHATVTYVSAAERAPRWVKGDDVWRFRQGLMRGIICGNGM